MKRCVGLFAMAGVLVACAASVPHVSGTGQLGTAPSSISVSLPSPQTTSVDGVSYTVRPVPSQGALTGSDPRLITVIAFDGKNPSAPECNNVAPSARLVSETANTVVTASYVYRYSKLAQHANQNCAYATISNDSLYTRFVIRLHAPLGRRRLLDAATGQQIGILNPGPVPEPTFVPAGYTPDLTQGFGPNNFKSIRQYRNGVSTVEITQSSMTTWTMPPHATVVATIHGAQAVADVNSYERCLDWSDTAGIISEVCTLGQDKSLYLSFATLTKIAQSIH